MLWILLLRATDGRSELESNTERSDIAHKHFLTIWIWTMVRVVVRARNDAKTKQWGKILVVIAIATCVPYTHLTLPTIHPV